MRLDQPDLSVRAQLSVSMECGGFAEVSGSVQPAPGDRELWVKLVPKRGAGGSETHVSRTGAFYFSGLDDGDYFLLVVAGQDIVQTRSFQISGHVRVNLNLEER